MGVARNRGPYHPERGRSWRPHYLCPRILAAHHADRPAGAGTIVSQDKALGHYAKAPCRIDEILRNYEIPNHGRACGRHKLVGAVRLAVDHAFRGCGCGCLFDRNGRVFLSISVFRISRFDCSSTCPNPQFFPCESDWTFADLDIVDVHRGFLVPAYWHEILSRRHRTWNRFGGACNYQLVRAQASDIQASRPIGLECRSSQGRRGAGVPP